MNPINKATIPKYSRLSTSTSRARSLQIFVISAVLLISALNAFNYTWDQNCLDNSSFDWKMFVKSVDDPSREANMKLFYAINNRAMEIPSVIQIIVDTEESLYNDKIDFCPRAQPMPIKQDRVDAIDARDVCFTVKVGPNQIQSAFMDMYDTNNQQAINLQRQKNLEEVVQEMKEYNFGNCMRDINSYLFASYTQLLYTSAHYKYSNIETQGSKNYDKYELVTPENLYLVREKMLGTVLDVINDKFTFIDHDKTKAFHDVIIFQMARALNIIHLFGFTHRDIKPDNFYVKKTVDRRLEVYLGEFHNSLMGHRENSNGNVQNVSGSPLFIPADANLHRVAQSNDVYQLSLTIEELVSHRKVEDVFFEQHQDVEISQVANNEIFEQDRMEVELELLVNTSKKSIQSDHQVRKIVPKQKSKSHNSELDMSLSFNVEAFDLSYLEVITKDVEVTTKSRRRQRLMRRQRILVGDRNLTKEISANRNLTKEISSDRVLTKEISANRNLTKEISANRLLTKEISANRILTKKDHQNVFSNEEEMVDTYMTDDQFGLVNRDNVAELNYNPISNVKTEQFIEQLDNITDQEVFNDIKLEKHSLPTGIIQTLNTSVIEEIDDLMNMEVKKNSVFKVEERPMKSSEIQDPIKIKDNLLSSQYFLDALVKNLAGKDIAKRDINHSSNAAHKKVCDDLLTQVHQYTITECLMILAAKAITQRPEHGQQDSFDYFGILDAQHTLSSMDQLVQQVFLADRNKVQQTATHTMAQYLSQTMPEKYSHLVLL